MPSLGVARTHWPVNAWIRLRLPAAAPLLTLMGTPPPPDPPLEILSRNPVPTDPRRKVWSFEEEHDDWVLRLIWDEDDPEMLAAEYRSPTYGHRPTSGEVSLFWKTVKEKTASLGPLRIEGADPRP